MFDCRGRLNCYCYACQWGMMPHCMKQNHISSQLKRSIISWFRSFWDRTTGLYFHVIIVNRGDWLGSPGNIKRTNKDTKIYAGRSLHNLLFCAHTPCMSHVTNTFLLVSSSVQSKQLLCFVQVQAKKWNNNIQQRTLTSFITIPLY